MATFDEIDYKGLPASVDAERTILGVILLDNVTYFEAAELRTDDFSLDSHRRIFAAIAAMMEDVRSTDVIRLGEYLEGRKELLNVGGKGYLWSLTEGIPRHFSIGNYVKIVKEKR